MSAYDLLSESQQETKFEIDHASEEKKEYLFLLSGVWIELCEHTYHFTLKKLSMFENLFFELKQIEL